MLVKSSDIITKVKTYVKRLSPRQDLRKEVESIASDKNIKAGVIITCVGNLTKVVLRMAEAKVTKTHEGSFEITSLVGTLEPGNSHLHIAISDEKGKTLGGHLKIGSIVGVTAEVVIGELENKNFKRVFDKETGYKELVIEEVF